MSIHSHCHILYKLNVIIKFCLRLNMSELVIPLKNWSQIFVISDALLYDFVAVVKMYVAV